ncbi:MAG TPA: LysR family transcriptional regulator [Micropepsaceae bacterium]|nr:LysR family transcriptional regulator [Micropepsaceae bacterium]
MTGPSLDEISVFVTVLDQKSFAGAAKRLGISPPRVSELVRTLEERLGVRLVERTTRSVAATEAGERLRTQLQSLLDDYQAALDSMSDFREKPAGTLRLTVATPGAHFVIAPVIGRFLSTYPEITVEVSADNRLIDIVAERYDAGLRPGGRLEKDMIAVRVSDDVNLVHVASPAYLAKKGTPQTPDDLVDHNCVRFRLPNGMLPWRFRGKDGQIEKHFNGNLIVDDLILGVGAAIDGVGVLQVLPHYVAREIAEGRLVPLLQDWAPPPIEGFHIYYPSRRQIRPALKVFVDFLRDAYRTRSVGQQAVPSIPYSGASLPAVPATLTPVLA